MHISDTALGYISVVGAILFFGSFGVPLKTKRVQNANVDPVVFQIYYSLSIFASSWLVLTYTKFEFTYFGIIGASLWVPASVLSISAINHLGMSVACGLWGGVTIVTSFLWGTIMFHQHVRKYSLAIIGVILLVIGIVGLSLSNTAFVKNLGRNKYKKIDADGNIVINETTPFVSAPAANELKKSPLFGVICAVILGIMNGSMMVPLQYAPKSASGINYVVSFGIGVIVVTPVVALIHFIIRAIINPQNRMPQFHVREAMIPGLITGLLWSVGNYCSIYATIYLGLTIGFPMTQLALVVSGLWGLFVFRELSGARTISIWCISLLIVLGGAALLAVFG